MPTAVTNCSLFKKTGIIVYNIFTYGVNAKSSLEGSVIMIIF